jgi:DNA-binding GntR family transcriptional regulator
MTRIRFGQMQRSTLGEDVYGTLRAHILEHHLRPGERVNMDALARELAVSPTPVREALARLEADGLLRKQPLVGYTVSPLLTREEFADLFDMRLLLECAAARWAAGRACSAEHERLERCAAEDVERVDDDGQWRAAFTSLDSRFHDLVALAAANPMLRDGITRLHAHLHLHRLHFPPGDTEITLREHQGIAAAVGAGDPDAAEEAMRVHLTRARERHLRAFDRG